MGVSYISIIAARSVRVGKERGKKIIKKKIAFVCVITSKKCSKGKKINRSVACTELVLNSLRVGPEKRALFVSRSKTRQVLNVNVHERSPVTCKTTPDYVDSPSLRFGSGHGTAENSSRGRGRRESTSGNQSNAVCLRNDSSTPHRTNSITVKSWTGK